MKRYVILFLMLGGLLAAPLCAQDKSSAPVAAPPAAAAPAAPAPTAEFLAKYDKFMALGEARASAEKKRAEYEAAVKVLTEQMDELRKELLAQIPPAYTWDARARAFVKLPEPPASEKQPSNAGPSAPPAAKRPENKPEAPEKKP